MDIILVIVLGILTYLFFFKPGIIIEIFYKRKLTDGQLLNEKKEVRYLGIVFLIGFILSILGLIK